MVPTLKGCAACISFGGAIACAISQDWGGLAVLVIVFALIAADPAPWGRG